MYLTFISNVLRPGIRSASQTLRNLFLGVAAIFFLCASVASAQLSGKGQIKGSVLDGTGAVVSSATVVATSTTRGTKITSTTTSAGDYTVPALDADIYTVEVSAPGFKTTKQQNVTVNALETAVVNVSLTLGETTESVTISAAPPQLETTNATLGSTMESDMYSALPIEMGAYGQPDQRRATDFAFLMPGVQGNNTTGNATTNTGIVNGSGSKGAVSDVYVDGVAFVRAGGNGDPRYVWTAISVDAVDQLQVQTSGYSAIYEGQGIQNYTIKQGGSKYHGSVYEFFRNTALDTWGFFGSAPNPVTGLVKKPSENSNEFGINLSGPLVPFGRFKDKLFFYGNYNGFRYANTTPTPMTFPTLAERGGDFSATGVNIYDPSTQTACTSHSTNGPCRYQYGYGYSGTAGPGGGPVATGAAINVIPASQFSAVAVNMQQFLPSVPNSAGLLNNYIAPNKNGLVNWSTTDRIDYNISAADTVTMVAAIGRQASSTPAAQTTAGRNVGPIPYNYGQAFTPKTAVGIVEETHIFTPHLVNQIKYGYARYNGPTYDTDELPAYSASSLGLTNLPAGAAQAAFPITTFAGTDAPTNWAGTTPGVTIAQNYTLVDNVQWVKGAHTFTLGAQIAWMLYNVNNATGGTTPLTLANAVTETAGITASSNTAPKYAALASSGLSYASFLVGQIDKASYTQYLQQIFGARFRPISPYIQDNWKVNSKLTLDLGLRYDYFPSIREVHDAGSFFNPTLANPVTGVPGALQFTGNGANTCNCDSPVHNYMKNFGPRLGLAYQIEPKTVIHASYGVMFTHGGAVGGSASSLGTLGFSSALSASSNGSLLSTAPLTGTNGAVPTAAPASGAASGNGFGTGYTTATGYTGTPSSMGYDDPYLGGRAPEFINWTLGFQHQWTQAIASTITYVGSQGHFLPTDGGNPRGYYSDQLDPKYALTLGSNLALTGAALTTYCAANVNVCPSYTSTFNTSQPLSQLLKPFPFHTVSDTFGYVANSNYHALQASLNMRPSHGLTFMANYTWSRSIDDGGTFRTGYAIPAGEIVNNPNLSYAQDRIERTVSTSNQPHHVVVTSVWNLPFGSNVLNGNRYERAVLGGYKLSGIFQAFSGSPLAITGSACQTNPAVSTCEPTLNPSFAGGARQNGKWGKGVTTATYNQTNNPASYFIVPSVASTTTTPTGPFINPVAPSGQTTVLNTATVPAYTIGNSPRTAPYNLYGPGNYQLDLALVRSFPLHLTESSRFNIRAEWYNVTNHTWFAVASTAVGNANFGQVTANTAAPRKSVQLSGRIEF
ncbi:Carboxypeptidase regulatory-like domain-containing protein [Granulicella rosea]|uniref:Carboxypeptidase regulatory-like domain-containing protein n=1 Tax=Granulicella rosea TaxID=474952 RepID=A0A239KRS2_9BACT|nr:carboxypeptidase-like regulatory domain-containing protein [Granulicella rosea]SNT20891.1 Carboxypeptidase regulatory-like domain-containing protein [Granulicella rosea]